MRFAKALVVVPAAGLKLGLFWKYGPLPSDDTVEYAAISRALLGNHAIWHNIPGWTTEAMPMLAFRPYGYPALLALGRVIAGSWSDGAIVLLQIALSLYVGARLFDVALLLGKSTALAVTATLFYFTSETLLWDQSLLSDSLYAGLFNLVVLTLAECMLGRRWLSPGLALLLGTLWAASILLREVGLYFSFLPVILIVLAVGRRRSLAPLSGFMLPVIVLVGLYAGWNAERTGGMPFVSITGVANYLRPSFDIAMRNWADPFDRGDTASVVLRSAPQLYRFPDQLLLLQRVHDRMHIATPLRMEAFEFGEYLWLLHQHPLAYLRYVAGNLWPSSFGAMLFDPLAAANSYFQLGVPPYRRVVPGAGLKNIQTLAADGELGDLSVALLSLAMTVASTAIWVFAFIAAAIRAMRQPRLAGNLRPEAQAALAMLLVFSTLSLALAAIHIETRLMLPAFPAGLLVAVYAFRPNG